MDKKIAFVELKPATQKGKKYQAIFYNKDKKKLETLAFGASGASDFTKHKDPKRKDRYIERHKDREDWSVPNNRGSLSRWILWNKPTISGSFSDYLKRFNLKKLSK
jgi:hypothetical protein